MLAIFFCTVVGKFFSVATILQETTIAKPWHIAYAATSKNPRRSLPWPVTPHTHEARGVELDWFTIIYTRSPLYTALVLPSALDQG